MEEKKFLGKSSLSKLIAKIEEKFAFKSHNHSKSDITDFPTSMKNPTSLTIQLNGTTNSSYDGSTQQTINITPSAIGASASSHTHDGRYYTESEIDAKLNTKANSVHSHDDIYYTESEINTMLSTKSNNNHEHSASDITDLTVTATELNYMDGVTSNVQSQLNSKSPSTHGHKVATPYVSSTNTGSNGFLSASDKAKLDGIAQNANNYSLPSAGTSLGGVKTGGDVTISSGVITVNDDSHNHIISNVDGLQSALDGKAASSHNHSATNITSGTLSADRLPAIPVNKLSGVIDAANLPSYVDDVLEYSAKSNFPTSGETGKIYIDTTTNKTYRWSGSTYVEISESLALGTTSSTAFRGDFGNSAYAHAVTNKGSAFASGLYKITTNSEGHVTGATAVVKSDITGLGIPASDTNTWRPVVDNLTSTDSNSSLSANQGSVLKSLIDGKANAHSHPYASSSHTHDDRYYTESEVDSKLSGKSNTGHTHDDRYYTESEIDTKLNGKANANHGNHVPDYCTRITDWNSATKNGWYMASDASNAPTTGWLYGEVISHNSAWCRQIVYKFAQGDSDITSGNNDKYERVFYNGTWGSWYNTSVRKAVPQNAVFTDTNTKVTSAANHYAPSADGNSGLNASASSTTAATWNSTSLVTGVNLERDSKGHVTGLSVNSIKMPANPNTDTHHTAKNIVGASSSATADATATNGNVWLNLIENGAVRSNTNIKGSGATTVTSDSSGNIVISSTDNNTTYSAGTGISLSGTQFSNSGVRSISTGTANGTISVNTNGTSANVSVKGLGSAAYTASSAYAASGHTHNYAGSSTAGGSATSAVKLDTSTAGSTVQPVYFTNGVPTACTYTLGKSVPSNAVFTDTNTAVTQTISTTTNADYRVLLSGTADNTTRTEGARKDADFTYNPSTNTLSVTKVKMGSATMSYDSTAGAVVISFS